jgi:uroporphyrin-III C-methyltransferase/precorrin-2 dehydrogenase/sirohydrochlorin ferrochelatase
VSLPRKPVETTPTGLEPLAVLPIFIKLEGRRAVLAGGNAAAAWKAKLLAAAGAEVAVFASEPSEEMRKVVAEAPAGSIHVHERGWNLGDLDGAAFAVAALDDEEECAAFVEAARAAGAIVNAVDRPHLCDVQFGAIVNRSPLVVGISTEGAAPVFAQAVRSRIEALLPLGFAQWVAAAKRWRSRLSERLPRSGDRRRFWQMFSDRALAEADRLPDEQDFFDLAADAVAGSTRPGAVTLVGAGPGDPELLTLKALRALRAADAILYDDLVAPEILDYARREARLVQVGKQGHGSSVRQDEINALIVELAREGKRVVRLKGGDPLIFGRATEEIDACAAAGLPVEIVPGVSSAQGAAARLGLSLTQRCLARRIQFITGHDQGGTLPDDLNWTAIADPSAVTAVYMPKRTLSALLDAAVANGLAPDTPAVALVNATRPNEHVERGTVATLAEQTSSCPAQGPMVVLIGRAINERAGASTAIEASSRTWCLRDREVAPISPQAFARIR